MGDDNSAFAYKMFIFSLVLLLAMPMMINVFVPSALSDEEEDLLEDYYEFTGMSQTVTKEAVWVLTGIYTPMDSAGSYGMTEDGWLYGARIQSYTPTQYPQGNSQSFTVKYEDGYYKYAADSADYDADKATGHKEGDLYTSVVFDSAHKSNIFFSEYGKYNRDGSKYVPGSGEPFYFEYTGWRYAFQPTASYDMTDQDGKTVKVINTTTSLSLIWYYYYNSNGGISGQLVISGSDGGTAYVTGDMLLSAFNSTTSTARFDMTFNKGVQIGLYVRLDPSYLMQPGTSIKDAYDYGYWSVMVTSKTADSTAYSGADYSLNVFELFGTMVDLMTFNYDKYNMSAFMGAICSFIIIIPLYAGLIALAIGSWQAMAMVGIMAAIEALVSIVSNLGWPW